MFFFQVIYTSLIELVELSFSLLKNYILVVQQVSFNNVGSGKYYLDYSSQFSGICAFKGSVIATADTSGMIKFHQLLKKEEAQKDKNDSTILETNLIYEEKKYNGHRHGFTHLDYDDRNEKLISGSQDGELVAWDFNSFKQLHSVDSKLEVMSVRVSWPLVAACSSFVISMGAVRR